MFLPSVHASFTARRGRPLPGSSQELRGTPGKSSFTLILYQAAFWGWQRDPGHRQEHLSSPLKPLPRKFLTTFAKPLLLFTALFPLLNLSQRYQLLVSLTAVSLAHSTLDVHLHGDINLHGDPQEPQKYRQAADNRTAPAGSWFCSSCHPKTVRWGKGPQPSSRPSCKHFSHPAAKRFLPELPGGARTCQGNWVFWRAVLVF